ncbi:MAG: acyltransferase [Clostridia bacterium]|nr:acyltransferase [Clostridia bacterium]
MILLYLILLIICLCGIKIRRVESGDCAYLDKKQTKSIQGIFVILVFFSHFASYINAENILDKSFVLITSKIGQLMVTMFLFYSGYGIMQSIKKDRVGYVNNFAKHRILTVYVRFFVSVILFLGLNIALGLVGTKYTIVDCLLAFIAWTSIGNSTWFMFATFTMYIIVLISFMSFSKHDVKVPLIFVTVLTFVYIIIFAVLIKRGPWWYNTVLCFPFGMWVSYFIDKIKNIEKNNKLYFIAVSCAVVSFLGLYLLQDKIPFAWGYCFMSLAFVSIVVLFTMKIKVGNKVLEFLGTHVFSVYILQRLMYIIFNDISDNLYLFFFISVASTLIVSICFDFLMNKLLNKIKKT